MASSHVGGLFGLLLAATGEFISMPHWGPIPGRWAGRGTPCARAWAGLEVFS